MVRALAEGRLLDGTVTREEGSGTGSLAGYPPTLELLGKYPWQVLESRPVAKALGVGWPWSHGRGEFSAEEGNTFGSQSCRVAKALGLDSICYLQQRKKDVSRGSRSQNFESGLLALWSTS